MARISNLFVLIFVFLSLWSDDDIRLDDANGLVIISDDEDDENVDVNNIVQTLRNRLKKYLYYPKRQKCNDPQEWQAYPQATLIELSESTAIDADCKHCGKSLRRHLNRRKPRTVCRNCRFLMRRYGKRSSQRKNQTNNMKWSQRAHHLIDHRSNTTSNHINIFKRLQQLGTSIYYENECRAQQQQQTKRHMSSIPHEMDTKAHKKGTNAWKQHRTNDSNEILMTFNTVVTEVFPIDALYNKYCDQQDDQISNSNASTNLNIQEILRNVPKSLTITIA